MDGLFHTPLNPLRVAVLAGGDSAEREISLQSGAVIVAALTGRGHRVTVVDPAEAALESFDWNSVDVTFLALHGTFGEDGGVQQFLEQNNVVFTGSDARSSKLAFCKSAAKERFTACGINTPPYTLIHEEDVSSKVVEQATRIGYPLVAKPDSQGSSLGVTIVDNETCLSDAVTLSFTLDNACLLERAIVGPEWTLAVIDDEPLPLIKIGTDRAFFDFDAKYSDDATEYAFDESISPAFSRRLTAIGLDACRALGTTGIARVDIMVDAAGEPWILEVNTIPGMTDHSLVPKAAARAGIDMGQLCEIILERAVRIGSRGVRRAS